MMSSSATWILGGVSSIPLCRSLLSDLPLLRRPALPDDVLADLQLGDNGKLLGIIPLHSISTTTSAKACASTAWTGQSSSRRRRIRGPDDGNRLTRWRRNL